MCGHSCDIDEDLDDVSADDDIDNAVDDRDNGNGNLCVVVDLGNVGNNVDDSIDDDDVLQSSRSREACVSSLAYRRGKNDECLPKLSKAEWSSLVLPDLWERKEGNEG
jgi:hypothetical protein